MSIILHGYFRSSAAHRVRIALALKGLSYDTRPWHLRKGEQKLPDFLALNPQGMVPAIEIDGQVILQSLAIIEYLDATRPQPVRLIPADPAAAARVRSLAQIVACDIHPLNNLKVLNHLRERFGQDDAGVKAWAGRWITEGFQALEHLLKHSSATGRFAQGDQPGLADLCLVAQVFSAGRFDVDLEPFPTIRRINDTCLEMQAFIEADPRNQPDTEL